MRGRAVCVAVVLCALTAGCELSATDTSGTASAKVATAAEPVAPTSPLAIDAVVAATLPPTAPTLPEPTLRPATLPPTAPPTVAPTLPPVAPQPFAGVPSGCDPNYTPCVPIDSDVDCAGGKGNGPSYVRGPVTVIGSDIYDLDRNGDGLGCE